VSSVDDSRLVCFLNLKFPKSAHRTESGCGASWHFAKLALHARLQSVRDPCQSRNITGLCPSVFCETNNIATHAANASMIQVIDVTSLDCAGLVLCRTAFCSKMAKAGQSPSTFKGKREDDNQNSICKHVFKPEKEWLSSENNFFRRIFLLFCGSFLANSVAVRFTSCTSLLNSGVFPGSLLPVSRCWKNSPREASLLEKTVDENFEESLLNAVQRGLR
jgi:hypothetical protein